MSSLTEKILLCCPCPGQGAEQWCTLVSMAFHKQSAPCRDIVFTNYVCRLYSILLEVAEQKQKGKEIAHSCLWAVVVLAVWWIWIKSSGERMKNNL